MSLQLMILSMMLSTTVLSNEHISPDLLAHKHRKSIPASVELNVLKALSFYPELKNTCITFILKRNLKSSVMQAQPVFRTLLKAKHKRRYRVYISTHFNLINAHLPILEVPDDVMIGWIGHELGHILDYENMSNAQLASYGYKYFTNDTFVKHAEMVADSLAVERGMGNYIVSTKRFILDHAQLPQSYKDKINRLYLSPDVIVEQVKKLEELKLKQQEAHVEPVVAPLNK